MSVVKKIRILFTDSVVVAILILIFLHEGSVTYLLAQARGQFSVLWYSEPIEKVLQSTAYSREEKNKVVLIQEVREFSEKKLGFEHSASYKKIFNQCGKTLLWIVTACEPFSLKEYEWKFPLVGKVSYKGFFDSLAALKERNNLIASGYDTDISPVSAWSTLGFFSDPVFSEMLKKPKGKLVELIFHELFHGTVYVPDKVELNENLADFFAEKATLLFLKTDTLSTQQYMSDKSEESKIDNFVLKCVVRLDSLYQVMGKAKKSKQERLISKARLMRVFFEEINGMAFLETKKRYRMKQRITDSKNAFFMHFERYTGLKDSLEKVFHEQFLGNLRSMIIDIKMKNETI